MKRLTAILIAALLAASLTGCGLFGTAGSGTESVGSENADALSPSSLEAASLSVTEPDAEGAVSVVLNGDGAESHGEGVSVSGGVITVSAGGVYRFTGSLADGRIIVNAPKQKVTLIFGGVSIACSYGSPVYIYKSSETKIWLEDGTANLLSDGLSYTYADALSSSADEEPNACLYSKSDLVIAGSGSLTVDANFNNGVTSKDTLSISGCELTVDAANHGINGKDSCTVDGASITVTAKDGDGIRSTNETDAGLGVVSLRDSVISVECKNDGVQAVTGIAVSGGSLSIVTGGGSSGRTSSSSAKGIKCDGSILIDGGDFVLDCLDDAVHAGGSILMRSGTVTAATADDAFHADHDLCFEGGKIAVTRCNEAYEAQTVTISGGEHDLTASDDGINAGGGTDNSSGFRGGEFADNKNCMITVSGGTVSIVSSGDGIDSNGSIIVSGGTITVFSSGRADGALDFNGTMTVTGGTLLAMTGGGMPEAPSSASQPVVVIGFGSNQPAGTETVLSFGDTSLTLTLTGSANHVVYSSPELTAGKTVTVSYNGTELGSAQLVEGIVTIGNVSGFGGNGDFGGPGGTGGNGRPGGKRP